MTCRRRPAERGAALVLVMLLVVALTALAHTTAVGARATVDATLLEQGRVAAAAAAEAGVELARVRLHGDGAWTGEVVTVDRCRVAVDAQRSPGEGWLVSVRSDCPLRGAGLPVRAILEVTLAPRPDAMPAVTDWRERR